MTSSLSAQIGPRRRRLVSNDHGPATAFSSFSSPSSARFCRASPRPRNIDITPSFDVHETLRI
jgi:hypothetical protein